MKWKSEWWGIIIEAETKHDRRLLKELKFAVGDKAVEAYEHGTIEEEVQDGEVVKLEFNR